MLVTGLGYRELNYVLLGGGGGGGGGLFILFVLFWVFFFYKSVSCGFFFRNHVNVVWIFKN